jgi:hypothetical protein
MHGNAWAILVQKEFAKTNNGPYKISRGGSIGGYWVMLRLLITVARWTTFLPNKPRPKKKYKTWLKVAEKRQTFLL